MHAVASKSPLSVAALALTALTVGSSITRSISAQPEGFVAWFVGMTALLGLVAWIGTRMGGTK